MGCNLTELKREFKCLQLFIALITVSLYVIYAMVRNYFVPLSRQNSERIVLN